MPRPLALPVPLLTEGFSPGNIERIYHGEAALTQGKPPDYVLSDREYEVVAHVADGMQYDEIAETLQLAVPTIGTHMHHVFGKLGLVARSQIAGFFPLYPPADILEGKKLEDHSKAPLGIMQALSVGSYYERVATERQVSISTIKSHMHNAFVAWGLEGPNQIMLIRIANALRTQYAAVLETVVQAEPGVPSEITNNLTLPRLAVLERLVTKRMDGNAPNVNKAEIT